MLIVRSTKRWEQGLAGRFNKVSSENFILVACQTQMVYMAALNW